MKLFKVLKSKKYSPEFGWLEVITPVVLGVKLWPSYHLLHDVVPTKEKYTSHDLEEMAMYAEWRKQLNLGDIDDETFTQILNTRF